MNQDKKDNFSYTYVAPTQEERKEVERIRKQYAPSLPTSKFDELKRLDKKVKRIPGCIALSAGICGCLIFGLGLTMCLEWNLMAWGVVVSAVGCAVMASAYYINIRVLRFCKKKYGQKILQLSQELL